MRKTLWVGIIALMMAAGTVIVVSCSTPTQVVAGNDLMTTSTTAIPTPTVSSGPPVDYAGLSLETYGQLSKQQDEWAAAGYAKTVADHQAQVAAEQARQQQVRQQQARQQAQPKPVVQQSKPAVQQQASSGGTGNAFLECVKRRESGGNYQISNSQGSGAGGAYQLMPQTAANTANHAGRPDLAGRPVTSWSPADQDAMAQHLYQWQGAAPWAGPGC